ncbi:psp operon transcriptional activator [Luminiphilus syltensis NOR5-1B]|uniref:Psp operon transcriptional activator n=1 Tax=Luminiphilus syltensis NOR5-1B TaxID=565045 RepID=B8KRJ3_9GAMM|nr:phage shock protein operon transcriptional activator [Luminiphilus syltensis]EED34244.1 psp operon transcriptional activator [Luminiphilus syltensis NOR5-1B]
MNAPQTIIGQSPALSAALDHLSALATIDRPVLVIGERGTGKELGAERLHFLSSRWSEQFIKVNCGAITESLLESELFGHEAGAFTGATKRHIGRFERADGGSLFLDELGTMSLRLQEKLLRLIEYGEFERVGGSSTLKVDVRIIAATNADLRGMANNGQFRWDLLDRLTFDVVRLPPLRERPGDIEELAQHFAVRMSSDLGWSLFPGFTDEAMETLKGCRWPGNVRELKNAVERSLFRWGRDDAAVDEVVVDPFANFAGPFGGDSTAEDLADVSDSPERLSTGLPPRRDWPIDFQQCVTEYAKAILLEALEEASQQQKVAAELLGLSYDQLRGLMRKHDLRTRPPRRVSNPRK